MNLFWLTVICLFAFAGPILASTSQDYYVILGLDRDATKDQIRRAYKRMSIKYHPDKNKDDEEAQHKFIEVSKAYEVLSDEKKKQLYDRYGEAGLQDGAGGGGGGFHDPFDIFEQFMGGGFGRRREPAEQKGPEIRIPLSVDLKDLFLGKVIEVSIDRQVVCHKCHGSGAKSSQDVKVCSTCNGHGIRVIKQMLAPGMYQTVQTTCDKCGGKGKIVTSTCPVCSGRKVMRGEDILDVSIERGMSDGEVIKFDEAGDQSPDYVAGDVKFIIKTKIHPVFTRRNDNLYMKQQITLVEALLGFEKHLIHLDNSTVVLKRSTITPPGYVQQVEGQGMPKFENPKKRGNLFVEYSIVFPVDKTFTEQERLVVKALLSSSPVADTKSGSGRNEL